MYTIKLSKKATKDLEKLSRANQKRVIEKLELLQEGLTGDIKKLTNFSPEYRLRIGDYRILFELEENTIIIYRVLYRKDAYQ
jgi:mRNA interferase RelE/StbE